uniref:transposase n=1 Tax=Methanosphaerula palustris TaxID=475088 RepID=UPI000321E33E
MEQLSPSSVSRISHDLDDQVKAFLNRLIEQPIPYLYVDASYFRFEMGPDMSPRHFWRQPEFGRMDIERFWEPKLRGLRIHPSGQGSSMR